MTFVSLSATVLAYLVTVAATLVGGLLLVWRHAPLRGTTLNYAVAWAVVSLAAIGMGEGLLVAYTTADGLPAWAPAVRLILATSTFCPLMAVLGARRPHHHAWQFIVISMWVMLSLPAWEALFLNRLEALDVGPVRGWFLWLMLAINLIAYLPTRFCAAAIVTTIGQAMLLAPFLPGLSAREPSGWETPVAALLFLVAIIPTAFGYPRAAQATNDFDRRWLAFRDRFGTMWALRVLERISAASQMYDWPLSLTWSGFYFHDADENWGSLPSEVEGEMQRTMDNLLRRFM